jgi:hypothetical protein
MSQVQQQCTKKHVWILLIQRTPIAPPPEKPDDKYADGMDDSFQDNE